MIEWYPALAVVLVLCCASGPKMRTWSALAISSLFGWFLPAMAVVAYGTVDFLSALIVLRKPAGAAQKLVGLGFAGMIFFHVGWLFSAKQDWQSYYHFQEVIGWGQLLVLASWGIGDCVGLVLRRFGFAGDPTPAEADIR